jgi:hypothetical protein
LGVLYNNWLNDVAKRFQKKFDDVSAEFNFDLGPEFEIAICKVLQDLLPRRLGVCREFVVGRSGDLAGDRSIRATSEEDNSALGAAPLTRMCGGGAPIIRATYRLIARQSRSARWRLPVIAASAGNLL